MIDGPVSPKQRTTTAFGRARWYPYYAGYSPEFVRSTIELMKLNSRSVVVDPWNGSGTTTTVCSLSGLGSIGFDLNPAMIVVAKARVLGADVAGSVLSLQRALLSRARRLSATTACDPLHDYFDEQSVALVRGLQRAVSEMLVEGGSEARLSESRVLGELSSLAAFFFVVLFRTVRQLLRHRKTGNPTWLRKARSSDNKLSTTAQKFSDIVLREAAALSVDGMNPESVGEQYAQASIRLGDSRRLPLEATSVDVVITSPPYCTRIDYAVATQLELAVLGVGKKTGFEELRRRLIGSTLIPRTMHAEIEHSAEVDALLQKIRGHPSKASSSYYYKTFLDYFDGLSSSMNEVARILKPGGASVIVVQDSTYKDVAIDLAALSVAEAERCGLRLEKKWVYESPVTIRRVNSRARRSEQLPAESVLLFRREY